MNRHGVPSRPRLEELRFGLLILAATALLGGCETTRNGQATPQIIAQAAPAEPTWRDVMHPDDQSRLTGVEASWAQALDEAQRGGFTRRLASEGALLDPDSALPRATPPPGSYRCRSIRIGPGSRRQRALVTRGPFFCFVGAEGPMLSFTQQTGPERPGGYLWEDSDARMIFIGAAARGREQVPPAYGDIAERNMVGIVERVGPFRYRVVFPDPASGATIEVLEMIPALS